MGGKEENWGGDLSKKNITPCWTRGGLGRQVNGTKRGEQWFYRRGNGIRHAKKNEERGKRFPLLTSNDRTAQLRLECCGR